LNLAAAAKDSWREELRSDLAADVDPYETARRLRRRILGLKRAGQRRRLREALDCLLGESRSFGVVFFLLEGISDPAFLAEIVERIQPLPDLQSEDEESHLADLIRVLAAAGDDALMPPVESYLLERPVGPHWASVPWAIWPRRPRLFARAWVRFFHERDAGDWTNTMVIKSFLAEPDAILAVREPLEQESVQDWDALREALLRQAGSVSWLSEEQRAALDRATR
jgi:hypothetical protein